MKSGLKSTAFLNCSNLGQSLDAKQACEPFLEDFCEVETLHVEIQLLEIQFAFAEATASYT